MARFKCFTPGCGWVRRHDTKEDPTKEPGWYLYAPSDGLFSHTMDNPGHRVDFTDRADEPDAALMTPQEYALGNAYCRGLEAGRARAKRDALALLEQL